MSTVETTKFLTDEATRQEHLSDLLDWITARANIWAREYKQHKAEQDRTELIAHDSTVKLLKGYLDSFKTTVQRYFPVPAGSDVQAFESVAANYPVFELIAG